MIIATRFGRLLVVDREDFHRDVWANVCWLGLPWWRRLWLSSTGRRAARMAEFGARYRETNESGAAFCEVSPLFRGAPPTGIRSARATIP